MKHSANSFSPIVGSAKAEAFSLFNLVQAPMMLVSHLSSNTPIAKVASPNVTAVVNLKGGVGKTTLAVNLAYGCAYFQNRRVLVVDLDPQANATQYLISQQAFRMTYLSDPPKKLTTYELFKEHGDKMLGRKPLKDSSRFVQRIYTGNSGYLDLVASKLDLSLLTFSAQMVPEFDQVRWLLDAIGDQYDDVIIDCPPTITRMLLAGFDAADNVLIPVKPDFLSTIGIPLLGRVIKEIYPHVANRGERRELAVLGIVLNMYEKQLVMTQESKQEIYALAKTEGYHVFHQRISRSTKFTWSSKRALPIFRIEPASRYAEEIEKLVGEYLRLVANSKQEAK